MPDDDIVRVAVIMRILRQRWRVLLTLAVVGAVLGAAATVVWPPTYASSSRVLIGGDPDNSQVLSEAQIAMSLVVLDRAAASLNLGVVGSDLQTSVTAAPAVAEGDVIEITATADSPDRARRLADAVTQEYIAFSTEISTKSASASSDVLIPRRDTLQKQVADTNRLIAGLRGSAEANAANAQGAAARAELDRLSSNQAQAVKELDELDANIAQAQAQAAVRRMRFSIIEPPVAPLTPVALYPILRVAGGAALAAVVGIFVLVAIQRADRRLRRGSDIAAALGAPLLGTVEAPAEGDIEPPANTLDNGHNAGRQVRRRVRHARWDAQSTTASRDQTLEHLRYRRVLARLRRAPDEPDTLLVVLADGDELAARAVRQLAILADGASADPPRSMPPTVLNVVSVCAARPTIPEPHGGSKVLVVVTSRTRTAWELLSIAEACQDAGHRVAGVLAVLPTGGAGEAEDVRFEQVGHSAAVSAAPGRAGRDPV